MTQLNGKRLVPTGEFKFIARDALQRELERLGAKVTGAISGKTDAVLVGTEPGQVKLADAQRRGIPLIGPDGVRELLAGKSLESVQAEPAYIVQASAIVHDAAISDKTDVGQIEVPESLHRIYSIIWNYHGRPSATIALDVLRQIETALGRALPRRYLALLCAYAADPNLGLQAVAPVARHLREDRHSVGHLPTNYATIIGITDEVSDGSLAIVCSLGRDADEVFAWDTFESFDGGGQRVSFDGYERSYRRDVFEIESFEHLAWWRFGNRQLLCADGRIDKPLAEALSGGPCLDLTGPPHAGFEPRIVSRPVQRVRHKLFGVGVIARELDGRVEVQFENGETRTLVSSYLEALTD
jgi:hypothetical protein